MSLQRKVWSSVVVTGVLCGGVAAVTAPVRAKGLTSPLVTGVRVVAGKDKIRVNVAATGKVQYRVLNLNDPKDQLVVEVFPAQLSTDVVKAYPVGKGAVEQVRVGQFSDGPDVVRVVVDLKSQVRYQINQVPGGAGFSMGVSTWEVASGKLPASDVRSSSLPAVPHAEKVQQVVRSERSVDSLLAARSRRRAAAPTGGIINLDFVNADIIYVLKLIAKEMNVNLVTDQSVKGSVTMSLKGVPAEGALGLMLKIAGFDYKKVGDHTIVVGSKETLDKIQGDILGTVKSATGKEPVLPIPLENAKAASVADTLKGVYPDVSVTVQADQNFVVVKGSPKQLRDIKEFVQKLDVPPPPPVVLKTEILSVKYADLSKTVALLKGQHPSLNYTVEDRLKSIIVTGQDRDIENMKGFLAQVDVPLPQVQLEIKVVDLSEGGSKKLGLTMGSDQGAMGVFAGQGGQPVRFTEAFRTLSSAATATSPFVAGSDTSLALQAFTRSAFVFGLSLNMVINSSDAKIITSPRVVAQSGEDASVLIGDKYPVVYFDPRAGQFQVQYVDIGAKVTIKPEVHADGAITMQVKPSVSTLKALVNNQYPQTGNVDVQTKVRVKDGETFILGGLLKDVETVDVNKLPFLADLPVLGEFFRNTQVAHSKSEIMIMVTPKLL